jgi:hypothetical protein
MHFGTMADRVGTTLVVILTAITVMMLSTAWVMKAASLDLNEQAAILEHEQDLLGRRTPLGAWSSAPFSSDLAPDDAVAIGARATDLDHKSDRLTEGVAAVALVGMLVALIAARPSGADDLAREATTPLASTSSNGTV